MNMFLSRALPWLLAVFLLAAPAVSNAATALVVYGDSLSDNGNLFALTGIPPAVRSNGPVAVEEMASILGLPLHDFAYIGATTGLGNYGDGGTPTDFGFAGLPGVLPVFNSTSGSLPALIPGGIASGIFVVWAGANDFLSPSSLDPTSADMIARSVANLNVVIAALRLAGATNILVPGMPDLGLSPYVRSLGAAAVAFATQYTDDFNEALRNSLPAGVRYYDTASLLRRMVADPAAYGFTNVTTPCAVSGVICATPDTYLFWDEFHPTTATHAILGQAFASNVPEPATFVVVLTSLALLAIARRRPERT